MIDFRYHLVSLVSVFIALAIGIVLGAGPLRDSIGDTLSSQVDLLRQDRAALQAQVTELAAAVEDRDALAAGLAPALTSGQLADRSLVVVALPGAEAALVDALTDAAEVAGASVSGVVAVQPGWTDPDGAAAREDVVQNLPADALADLPSGAAGTPASLATALAGAVGTVDGALVGQPAPTGEEVLGLLESAGLVDLDGDPEARADLALVVAPAADDAPGDGDPTWTEGEAAGDLALLQALSDETTGAVLAGPLGAVADGGALGLLRADDLVEQVSGVDSADSPAGAVVTVLALGERLGGGVGQYGTDESAEEPVPPLAAAEPAAGAPG